MKENIIERYIHFVIIGVAGLIGAALLFLFVLKSPNAVEYNGDSCGPGEIDERIMSQARRLDTQLDKAPEKKSGYQEKYSSFKDIYAMSLKDYEGLPLPIPGAKTTMDAIMRQYDLPVVGSVEDVEINYLRTVGFVPLFAVSSDTAYAQVDTKPDNLDIVTVQAKFDVAALKENLDAVFASSEIKREWRDRSLTKPIFAKVQLQRQRMTGEDSWGEWENVSATKINQYAEMMDFPEKVGQIPQGIDVLKLQFQSGEILKSLLQPQSYDIAEIDMSWYPPEIFEVYAKQKLEAERERLKAEKEERTRRPRDRGTRRERDTRNAAPAMGPGMGPGMGAPGMGAPADNRRDDRRREKRTRDDKTTKPARKQLDPEQMYQEVLIPEEAQPDSLDGELVFWAHDDSAEPGYTYRYRIRLGIFNPVAGQNWYTEDNAEYNDSAILWSDFSGETDSVFIPKQEYILATDKTRDNGVKVQVSKLILGNWRSHEFVVYEGDPIGEIVEEPVLKATDGPAPRRRTPGRGDEAEIETEEVDYTTGAKFVGIEETEGPVKFGKTFKNMRYYQMVYTYDGVNMLKIGIRDRFWPADIQKVARQIKDSQKKVKEVLEARGSSGGTRRSPGTGPGMPGMGPGFNPMFGPMN